MESTEKTQSVDLVPESDENNLDCIETDPPQGSEDAQTKSGLQNFPDIRIPGMTLPEPEPAFGINPHGKQHSLVRLAPLGPNSLFMIVVLALAAALLVYQWLYNRSETEKLFRYYVDQAQLSALNGDDKKAISAWKDAIESAIALGDTPKLIGNLYLEKAKSEIAASKAPTKPNQVETSKQQIIDDIHKALTHYEKDSFTTLAQIQAQELLLSILPMYTESFASDEEDMYIDGRRTTAEKLLREGKQSESLKVFTEVVMAWKGLTNAALEDDIKQLMTRLSTSPTNAEELFPITSALFTYQTCASAQTRIEEGQKLNLLLDQALKAGGHAKNDYQYLKKLGDRMFEKANYHGANLAYWRCQALKDSAEVREHLKFCYLKLHPTKPVDAQAAISAVVELIRLNVKAFGQDSKQVTGALERHAELLESTGNFEQSETLRRTVFDRIVEDKSGRPFYDRYGQIISDPARQAENAIMKLYVTEGKFKEALAWYRQRQPQSDQTTEMDFTFVDLCTEANWLSDPMLRKVIDRNWHLIEPNWHV